VAQYLPVIPVDLDAESDTISRTFDQFTASANSVEGIE
jgi:hypothetical protein